MNKLPLISNVLFKVENSSSLGMFARDTGGCLVSRIALSRSKDESREISFAEISESLIFYFSAPAIAKIVCTSLAKIYGISKDTLSSSINDVANNDAMKLKKIKLGKFGQIAATFGIILPLIYGIAPVRNLITQSKTGKSKFMSVIELNQEKDGQTKQNASQKAKKLIRNLLMISAASLGLTTGILLLSKRSSFYNRIEPAINKIIKYFDFTSNCDLENAHYGFLIYPASIAGYFSACRDKYEVKENIRRFSITVPLLFFGEKLIRKPIYRTLDKLFKTNVVVEDIKGSFKTLDQNQIMKLPKHLQKQLLKTKNAAYLITFLINAMTIAAAISLVNRISTKKAYEKNNLSTNNINQKFGNLKIAIALNKNNCKSA